MTNGDIAKEYREAKDPKKQIEILADYNKTTKSAIVDILRACGEKVPGNYGPKKKDELQVTMSEPAALKEAEQPETPIQPETPVVPIITRDHILSELVKAEKKVTALEDVLQLIFGALDDYIDASRGNEDRNEGAFVGYLSAVRDTFEALHGPIVR